MGWLLGEQKNAHTLVSIVCDVCCLCVFRDAKRLTMSPRRGELNIRMRRYT